MFNFLESLEIFPNYHKLSLYFIIFHGAWCTESGYSAAIFNVALCCAADVAYTSTESSEAGAS